MEREVTAPSRKDESAGQEQGRGRERGRQRKRHLFVIFSMMNNMG
jgi:hypothetical protein